MKNEKEFYKKFKPQLTPKRMLELGVFGGAYFADGSTREFPKSWFTKAKLSKTFDVNLNRFKIESGLSRKEWIDKGWIFKEDPLGWFQWYCRFKNGRRIPEIDQVQIKRWKAFGDRHGPAVKKIVKKEICIVEEDKGKLYFSGLIIQSFRLNRSTTMFIFFS
jgi:hypothetical protein